MDKPHVLAVDFGTTNSYYCKCPADQTSPVGVDFGVGKDGIATAILYRGQKEPLVGDAALHEFGETPAKERTSWCLRTQFKPDIAASDEAYKNAEDFLRNLIVQCERLHIDIDPGKREVIFGAPSESESIFNAKLSQIAQAAGYGNIKIVDEPIGALLYHLWHKDFSPSESQKGVLFVDFGGGTCDFAFLCRMEVRHSWGDFELGGRLLDDIFFQWFLEQNPSALREMKQNGDTYYVHSYLCREAKELFSRTMARDRNEHVSKFIGRYGSISDMTWGKFMERAANYIPGHVFTGYLREIGNKSVKLTCSDRKIDLLDWFKRCLTRGLEEKNINIADIKRVILAGGSSQWPFVSDIISDVLHIDQSAITRSDRPYVVISEGLSILPALKQKLRKTRQVLKDDLPIFCEKNIRPWIKEKTGAIASALIGDITSNLFDAGIKPVLTEFRKSGGSVASLRNHISSEAKVFEPEMRTIVEERINVLTAGLSDQLTRLVVEWFASYGLSIGDDRVYREATVSMEIDGKILVPDLYTGILELIGWFTAGTITSIVAGLCGGGGVAFILSGPIGWIIGAILAALVSVLSLPYGVKRAKEMAETWNAPAWLIKRNLTESKITKARNKVQAHLKTILSEKLEKIESDFEDRVREVVETQIEALSEIETL
ncbi:MAG: Hsp70 family protein [Sedimentisphaerales bacterium]|nr:Hsp70 family protein [Sedimentisphaerales bacterium]